MKFRKLQVKLYSIDGMDYGYNIDFSDGLNIVRGDNSSGKSTFVNSLIYSLGMEEIIGSKGNSSLPYALKTRFDLNGEEKKVVESSVFLEFENSAGEVITVNRAIVSNTLDTKLVKIILGKYLTGGDYEAEVKYTFVHDPGSAQDPDKVFFAFLERFLDIDLPNVSDSKGKEAKLYLQSIFSAMIIEQKRGWTDYIANIPYFGISGMREKVTNYILDLDVFRNAKLINDLQIKRNSLINKWSELVTESKLLVENKGYSISGLSRYPVTDFDPKLVSVGDRRDSNIVSIDVVRSDLISEYRKIDNNEKQSDIDEPKSLIENIEKTERRIDDLLVLNSMLGSQIKIDESQVNQYKDGLIEIEKDLKSNKLTRKLVELGADKANLSIAKGKCNTCLQVVDDILLPPDTLAMPMELKENIQHLENQKKMTKSLVDGLERKINADKDKLLSVNRELTECRKNLVSLRKDMKFTSKIKESDIRRKINLETRIDDIKSIEEKISEKLEALVSISIEYKGINGDIQGLGKHKLSNSDWRKVNEFSSSFKSLARSFGYRSADVGEIEIKTETMLPYLKDIELREVEWTSEGLCCLIRLEDMAA
ncbi:hypothetical protein [Enterovibrio nigricans]|uniref:AAA domain-containing protein n=1 Tax=Enterovibrio nigricans DSM 22720 TaxID=1121868 RepID=A0A1T4UQC7_9GAMM|nr:hypothetical protein [Enterovibrio nigricans]SKA54631.1 hypothetical protein SAMN02745132_02182 [Enterovibrio nigricans DSM 22720]